MEQTAAKAPFFDRSTTSVIKGIALIMMFIHHFFTFPAWWVGGVHYPLLEKLAPYFSMPLKLCVPVFCFITGYFYCFNRKKTLAYSCRKITDILVDYWVVYLLLAVAAAVTVQYPFTPGGVLLEMLAIHRPVMCFCWYVAFYCVVMLIMPLLSRHLEKTGVHWNLFLCMLVVPVLIRVPLMLAEKALGDGDITDLLGDFLFFPSVIMGYIFAKYDLFEKLKAFEDRVIRARWLHIAVWVLAAVCAAMGRYILPAFQLEIGNLPGLGGIDGISFRLDPVYAAVFIYCVANLCGTLRLKITGRVLAAIGKQSLLMWFLHCIFFNRAKSFFQPFLYLPKNPVLVLLWGLALCYAAAFVLDLGISRLIGLKNKVMFKK